MFEATSHLRYAKKRRAPKVALVHDYLIQDGGAERVLLTFHEMYPRAPIYTLFHVPENMHKGFSHADIRPTNLNRLPFAKTNYQWYLPFMAEAIENIDLTGYDIIISSCSSFAKGIITDPESLHICYLHTPTRFLWQERLGYVHDLPQPKIIKSILPRYLHKLRTWDRLAAERPDIIVTNSQISKARIKRFYQRDAEIIEPPVEIDRIPLSTKPGSYWLTGGRLVPYKRFDLVVRAFAKLNLPLKIFGEGPERSKLEKMAGSKTEFLGHIPEQKKIELFQNAIAFLHPQIEDFGITAVEAMAAGRPIIAFGQGGAAETVLDGVTGQFFEVQCWEDIGNAAIRFDPGRYDPRRIRAHAERFAKPRFKERMKELIERSLANV
jgi:glycosyltransferase involved in cell wall biosynthesis